MNWYLAVDKEYPEEPTLLQASSEKEAISKMAAELDYGDEEAKELEKYGAAIQLTLEQAKYLGLEK